VDAISSMSMIDGILQPACVKLSGLCFSLFLSLFRVCFKLLFIF
jgi:hypothetical protein